jgi:hypothetical protein
MRDTRVKQIRRRLYFSAHERIRKLPLAVFAAIILSSCALQLEPSYDARIVKEIETLTLDTQTFFASITNGIPAAGFSEREKAYAALAGRAAAIKIYAEARPAPSGRLVGFFQNLISVPPPPSLSAAAGGDRSSGSPSEDRYENATAGYMEDYLRNLKRLADKDKENAATVGDLSRFEAAQAGYRDALAAYQKAYSEWVSGRGLKPADIGPAPTPPLGKVSERYVGLRQIVLNDILHDALFYERDILNRKR